MNDKQRIIAYCYSQTGTLISLLDQSIQCLKDEYDIVFIPIKPNREYPFPWKWSSFFDVFTDSVLGAKIDLCYEKIYLKMDDIIILGFQPWFLHLSIPFNCFSETDYFRHAVRNRKVILFSCGRNTCNNALQILKSKVVENKGAIISEIVISDKSTELLSEYQFVRWFFTGRKNPFLKMNAQIVSAQSTIEKSVKYGTIIVHNIS